MRFSQMFIPTMKEVPADAQVASHRLMTRAGMIRKVAAGIYSYLPLGWRVLKKVSKIVREEMDRAGAQEIQMPMVQPAKLWQKSGRWSEYGPELLRLNDRKQGKFCLGPTHEEVITDIVGDLVRSYRELPMNLYQIQTKFRDEIRPRFGLMRGREFLMKDAYSFSMSKDDAVLEYERMKETYSRIFQRCGLEFRVVEAAVGAIGGNLSHEFQVLAQSGEDQIATCSKCEYAANIELAALKAKNHLAAETSLGLEEVHTPNHTTISEVADFLGVAPSKLLKSVMYLADGKPVMSLCLGHREISEAKLKRVLNSSDLRLMSDKEIEEAVGPLGYIGPVGIDPSVCVVADNEVVGATDLIAGAMKPDFHLVHVACERDFQAECHDLRTANEGDSCAQCGGMYHIQRGIEVGHIFYLGTKYSKSMRADVLDENGEKCFLEMGCYGIGIGRTAAAAIEQNHDEQGIIWPLPIAPFQVYLLRIGDDEKTVDAAEKLYTSLLDRNVEVLYDDRLERAGVKFKDSDLIGVPIRVTMGSRSLENGRVELSLRRSKKSVNLELTKAVNHIVEMTKTEFDKVAR